MLTERPVAALLEAHYNLEMHVRVCCSARQTGAGTLDANCRSPVHHGFSRWIWKSWFFNRLAPNFRHGCPAGGVSAHPRALLEQRLDRDLGHIS
jgi:hypothetical protein